ncbi:CG0192-related protein [Actinoplanes friuliensis]|uniref:Maltokinase N-terminal cap domain-containing protein n=1 Tax=Actinoplanes friuliensis DSM 7358 TaxID=1246995 RepID=U5VXJ0_9ACTN|nr:hypothetical protein [Actinoplanes friuliensis]AGZ40450.1 hypothetical protein AFR_10805 [Actinoplanes friuliensis DSM 7358]
MALLYRTELTPSKLDLLAAWLPGQAWFDGAGADGMRRVAAYRIDDPAGEVGVETMLVRVGDGPIHQVPLTYRGAPLDGAEAWLIGTAEHGVLGRRWIYDGLGDPVFHAGLADAIAGAPQAEEYLEVDGRRELRPATMTITGSGVAPGDRPVTVVRQPGESTRASGATLTGVVAGLPAPLLLAYAE